MKTQTFANHRKFVPGYHFFTLTGIIILLIGSIINLIHAPSDNVYSASLIILSSFLLFVVAFYARAFALKAQDRAIIAEEKFRYYILTKELLPNTLSPRQIIGLRFASDEEFPGLVKKANDEHLSEDDIKKAIKNWKGDYYRA